MKSTFKNILITVSLALSAVSGLAQTQEELSVKTLREITIEAKETDLASLISFKGTYSGKTVPGSQQFSFVKESKKIGWWTSGCGEFSYIIDKVFETSDFYYIKTVAKKPSSPVCTPSSWVMLLEIPKNSKEGYYSSSTREGTIKID